MSVRQRLLKLIAGLAAGGLCLLVPAQGPGQVDYSIVLHSRFLNDQPKLAKDGSRTMALAATVYESGHPVALVDVQWFFSPGLEALSYDVDTRANGQAWATVKGRPSGMGGTVTCTVQPSGPTASLNIALLDCQDVSETAPWDPSLPVPLPNPCYISHFDRSIFKTSDDAAISEWNTRLPGQPVRVHFDGGGAPFFVTFINWCNAGDTFYGKYVPGHLGRDQGAIKMNRYYLFGDPLGLANKGQGEPAG